MANIYGKVFSLSGELRNALVESLLLMATFPTATPTASDIDFGLVSRRILERVLPHSAAWRRWASLGSSLILLGECDPDFFLSRIEEDLASHDPEIVKLFQDKGQSLFVRAEHTTLLWALETLSWSPQYFGRVLAVLCDWGDRDPGGTYSNRPEASAVNILYFNHTTNTEQRVDAIRRMVKAAPATAWKVIAGILPENAPRMGVMPHMPRWRAWANQHVETAGYDDKAYQAIIELLGTNLDAWATVVEGLLELRQEETCGHLEAATRGATSATTGAMPLWDSLRRITHHQRQHAGAPWTMSVAILARLEKIRDLLQPEDPVLRHHWLFASHTELPDVDRMDFDRHADALYQRQADALRDVIAAGGYSAVKRLIKRASWPQNIGLVCGQELLLQWKDISVPEAFDREGEYFEFSTLYASGRFFKEEWACIGDLDLSIWTANQLANLALALPVRRDVWDWLLTLPGNVSPEYWRKVNIWFRRLNDDDKRYAIEQLIGVDRPFTALQLADCERKDDGVSDGNLISGLLIAGLQSEEELDQHCRYTVGRLITALQKQESCPLNALALIEWGYLPLIDKHSHNNFQPSALQTAVYQEPEFVVTLLEAMYREENSPPSTQPLTDHARMLAERARMFVNNLSGIPGRARDGSVDFAKTSTWIEQVRTLAKSKGRASRGDFEIGKLLFNCVKGRTEAPDGELADAIESLKSDSLIDGFSHAIVYGKGMSFTSRNPMDGGKQEWALARKYKAIADTFAGTHPAVSALYSRVSQQYEGRAREEDLEAERERLGR